MTANHPLRTGVVLSNLDHLAVVRVSGRHAGALLDRVLPCALGLREGQMRVTLLLTEAASIWADVVLASDRGDYWLIADGPREAELLERLAAAQRPGEAVWCRGAAAEMTVLGVDGPTAPAFLESAGHPGLSGMASLTLAWLDDDVRCLRVSRLGEFGYWFLLPRGVAEPIRARLAGGAPWLGRDETTHAMLEAGSFDIHVPALAALTPLELHLQWRVSRAKPGVTGMAALADRVASPHRRRIVGLRGPAIAGGLRLEGERVGEVLQARKTLDGWIGLGLLPADLAHPGFDVLTSDAGPVRTVSRPFLHPRRLA